MKKAAKKSTKKIGTPNYKDEAVVKAFGKKVRAYRLKTGKTIEQFALDNGLFPNQLGRIERGESNPTISYVFKIAKILGVPPSELLDFEY